MKSKICLLLALVLAFTALCGCDLNAKPASFYKCMELLEDGVVPASVLEKLKDENKVAVFYGESGGIEYEWTVFGSDIGTPEDTSLALNVLNESDDELTFSFGSEAGPSFAPFLSIHPTKNWNADSAVVYLNAGDALTRFGTAYVVTVGNGTALNFAVTKAGTFTVRAGEDESVQTPNPSGTVIEPGRTDDGGRVISDGSQAGQDKYLTDPVPEGKPMPVEPEDQQIDESIKHTCTIEIECTAIFNNIDDLESDKFDALPKDGVIFPKTTVEFYEGESVYDVLDRVCGENGIHMEVSWTPIYNSVYVEGIHNLYEFDCGSLSGWMYRVNGWYPNYGCSRYMLSQGDVIEWHYTCELGADIGGGYAVGSKP